MEIKIAPVKEIEVTEAGSTFEFPFDYLRKVFIHTIVNEETEDTRAFTVIGKSVVFDTPLEVGDTLKIFRSTPTTPLVSWADASVLKARDMTIQQVQELHILEEQQVWQEDAYSDTIRQLAEIEFNIQDIVPRTQAIYDQAIADTTAIKEQTQGIYAQTIADIDAIRVATEALRDNTQDIYDNTIADADGIKEATQGIYDRAVAVTNTIKAEAQAIVAQAASDAELSKKWAMSATTPDGVVDHKSSKTWAEQTASYLDEAVKLANYAEALAAKVPVWNNTTTYNVGDVVMMPDGSTYRAIADNTGESPFESFKWTKVQTVANDTFEKDQYGDAMVKLPATASDQWDVDASGDVMIKPII